MFGESFEVESRRVRSAMCGGSIIEKEKRMVKRREGGTGRGK
jgi:hypothetical protein